MPFCAIPRCRRLVTEPNIMHLAAVDSTAGPRKASGPIVSTRQGFARFTVEFSDNRPGPHRHQSPAVSACRENYAVAECWSWMDVGRCHVDLRLKGPARSYLALLATGPAATLLRESPAPPVPPNNSASTQHNTQHTAAMCSSAGATATRTANSPTRQLRPVAPAHLRNPACHSQVHNPALPAQPS